MKNVTLSEILEKGLTEDIVERMMRMGEDQSPEWRILFSKIPSKLVFEYGRKKGKIQKKQFDIEIAKLSQREREIKHLKGFHYVANHYDGLTFDKELIIKSNKRAEYHEWLMLFEDHNSVLSQMYLCDFEAERIFRRSDYLDEFEPIIKFSSVHQFVAYHNCLFAFDFESANMVLATKDCLEQNEIVEKLVIPEDWVFVWDVFKWEIAFDGIKAKFEQNKELRDILLKTKDTTIVYANPNEVLWGNGLALNNPNALIRSKWRGNNLLGEMLIMVREMIKKNSM